MLSGLIAYGFRSERHGRIQAQEKAVENLRLAHDLERAKSNFVATVGHDLRGPVQAISHFTESLKLMLPETSRENLDKIDRNVTTISELIDSMVMLSQAEWQSRYPELQDVSLSQLLTELALEYQSKAADKNIRLEIDAPCCLVRSDRVCLSQILRNLIDNAIKYTEEGHVRVTAEEELYKARVAVEDTGRGIPNNKLANIFDEFYQVDKRGDKEMGVGLGLSIVARLTRMLGIEMTVQSTYGVGSRFELEIEKVLPGAEKYVESAQEEVGSVQARPPGSLDEANILVVSEDDSVVSPVGDRLIAWGGELRASESVDEAIRSLRASDPKPDLILTEAIAYQRLAGSLSANDTPIFVAVPDGVEFAPDKLIRTNHSIVRPSMEPMKFRALIQRAVRLPLKSLV